MAPTTLTDLPPELLDHIVEFVDSAKSVSHLGAANKTLQTYVESNAWRTFVASKFPSIAPVDEASYKNAARSLTTLSRAWDRRALVARYIEPQGQIRSFPQDQILDKWPRPRGQTLGFTPQLDCFEAGDSSLLAFSAGAGICIRRKGKRNDPGRDAGWMVYRPPGAVEGKDDVTSLHLLRPWSGGPAVEEFSQVITGTASGDLQLQAFPISGGRQIPPSHLVTQGQPVRSSSLLQRSEAVPLLAATLGDSCISLYELDSGQSQILPKSTIDIQTRVNGHRNYRAWSSQFLSPNNLAVGLGPCTEPLHIYSITPAGIEKEPLRKYSLHNDAPDDAQDSLAKSASSIYPITPLAPESHSMAGSEVGQVFLSGAYDGIIRLHDLRSHRHVEQKYTDPTDDSAIYSLLPRGQESVAAGSSRHSLLKIFDLRLGARAYSYLNVADSAGVDNKAPADCNIFLKRNSAAYSGRGGGNNWARRSAESSVYSLTSPSPCSPFVYAGLENAVLELAFTSVLDRHPDVVFSTVTREGRSRSRSSVQGFSAQEVVDLSMYDQTAAMAKLRTQRSLPETVRLHKAGQSMDVLPCLDERWVIAS